MPRSLTVTLKIALLFSLAGNAWLLHALYVSDRGHVPVTAGRREPAAWPTWLGGSARRGGAGENPQAASSAPGSAPSATFVDTTPNVLAAFAAVRKLHAPELAKALDLDADAVDRVLDIEEQVSLETMRGPSGDPETALHDRIGAEFGSEVADK